MSTPNPIAAAAAPSLISVLQAVQTFVANLGTDPAQIPVKLPGALQVLLGNIELQLPTVAAAEFGVVTAEANTKINAWITHLKTL